LEDKIVPRGTIFNKFFALQVVPRGTINQINISYFTNIAPNFIKNNTNIAPKNKK